MLTWTLSILETKLCEIDNV